MCNSSRRKRTVGGCTVVTGVCRIGEKTKLILKYFGNMPGVKCTPKVKESSYDGKQGGMQGDARFRGGQVESEWKRVLV